MEEIADRLGEALAIRRWGKKKLSRELDALNVKGSSVPSIRRYLSGEKTPSVEFLETVADLCGVRRAWLMCGEGARTEAAQAREDSDETKFAPAKEWTRLLGSNFSHYSSLGHPERTLIYEAWLCHYRLAEERAMIRERREFDRGVGEAPSGEERRALGNQAIERVARAFNGPLEELGIEHLSREQLHDYIVQVGMALIGLVPRETRAATYVDDRGHWARREDH